MIDNFNNKIYNIIKTNVNINIDDDISILDIIKLLLDSGVLGNPIPDNLRQIYANKKTNNKKQKDQIQKLIMNYGK